MLGVTKTQFLECKVVLCDYHREQAWERWLTTTANGMRSIKSFVLPRLRRIANAQSVKQYEQTVSDLKESDEWKADTSEKFRNYVSKTQLLVYRVSDALKTKFK